MSNHDKIAKLKEYIKNFVIKELEKDEEIDEASTTASAGIDGTGTGHYDTPHAFASGSVGHKSPEVGGYKKVNESFVSSGKVSDVFLKLKSKGFGNKKFGDISKELSKHYKTPGLADVMASMFKEIWMKGNKKEAEKEVLDWLKTVAKKSKLESINESQPFADFPQFPKLSRDQQESLDELFGFAESYQIFNSFNNNPKKFIQTLDDMAKIRKASKKQPKGVNFNKGKKQFVKEVTNQEISALQKVQQGLEKLRKDYTKIANIGDKTLKDREYNDYYEYILTAKQEIDLLVGRLRTKQMLGEGRYHDWRNDESLTPKQKIGQSMREIRDALNELDKTVKMNLKLKTELKMKSEDYWKNTHKALTKISERLVKMANKVGNLK